MKSLEAEKKMKPEEYKKLMEILGKIQEREQEAEKLKSDFSRLLLHDIQHIRAKCTNQYNALMLAFIISQLAFIIHIMWHLLK